MKRRTHFEQIAGEVVMLSPRLCDLLDDIQVAQPPQTPPEQPAFPAQVKWEQAACRNLNVADFYTASRNVPAAARLRCDACPIQRECVSYALDHEAYGHWGLTAWERAALGGVTSRTGDTRRPDAFRAAATALHWGITEDTLVSGVRQRLAGASEPLAHAS